MLMYPLRHAGAAALGLTLMTAPLLVAEDAPVTAPAFAPDSRDADFSSFKGKVVETMVASRYTYALIDNGKDKVWVAGPVADLKVGDEVEYAGAMPMKDFYSPSLKRRFDVIYFASRLGGPGTAAGSAPAADMPASGELPAGHPPIGSGHPTQAQPPAQVPTDFSDLVRPEGARTIAALYAEKATLAGQPVTVVAKVVKATPDIMGKNWLHLRDGTGTEGRNDLTVTTKALAAVGDPVTLSGILSTNRDFGAGYRYEIIIEDALLQR